MGGGGERTPSVGFSRDFLPSMGEVLCDKNHLEEEDFNRPIKTAASCRSVREPECDLREKKIKQLDIRNGKL